MSGEGESTPQERDLRLLRLWTNNGLVAWAPHPFLSGTYAIGLRGIHVVVARLNYAPLAGELLSIEKIASLLTTDLTQPANDGIWWGLDGQTLSCRDVNGRVSVWVSRWDLPEDQPREVREFSYQVKRYEARSSL